MIDSAALSVLVGGHRTSSLGGGLTGVSETGLERKKEEQKEGKGKTEVVEDSVWSAQEDATFQQGWGPQGDHGNRDPTESGAGTRLLKAFGGLSG